MNFRGGQIGRRDNVSCGEQYLESVVRVASPAKLRFMLIERAVGVCESLEAAWTENPRQGANENSLKLFELVNELLRGVVGSKQGDGEDVCKQVADLYVFLLKHLLAAEQNSDVASIQEIRGVLQIEAETWKLACANELSAVSHQLGVGSSGTDHGLNLEA
ncbi:MAG: flagellar biosynthesis protein FliS [Rhodopirellula sp.]|nr:flagellar biosynthesis protein FliS [Rhodopirellula sp.]